MEHIQQCIDRNRHGVVMDEHATSTRPRPDLVHPVLALQVVANLRHLLWTAMRWAQPNPETARHMARHPGAPRFFGIDASHGAVRDGFHSDELLGLPLVRIPGTIVLEVR